MLLDDLDVFWDRSSGSSVSRIVWSLLSGSPSSSSSALDDEGLVCDPKLGSFDLLLDPAEPFALGGSGYTHCRFPFLHPNPN